MEMPKSKEFDTVVDAVAHRAARLAQEAEAARKKTAVVDAILRKACATKPAAKPTSYERVRGNLESMSLNSLLALDSMIEQGTSTVVYPAILCDLAA